MFYIPAALTATVTMIVLLVIITLINLCLLFWTIVIEAEEHECFLNRLINRSRNHISICNDPTNIIRCLLNDSKHLSTTSGPQPYPTASQLFQFNNTTSDFCSHFLNDCNYHLCKCSLFPECVNCFGDNNTHIFIRFVLIISHKLVKRNSEFHIN